MDGKYLLLFTDKLDRFSGLMENIKKSAPYKVDVSNVSDLLKGSYKSTLDSYKPSDIFIGINGDYFTIVEQEIRSYLESIEKKPFTNFLNLFDNRDCDPTALCVDSKNCFILFGEDEFRGEVICFHLFVNNLFDKAVLSFRLSDYIYYSFKEVVFGEILKKKTKELEMLKEELERRNKIDNLTNLYNRRALFEFLENEKSRTIRYLQHVSGAAFSGDDRINDGNESFNDELIDEIKVGNYGIFSIMMIDLDHFKKINDTYGHLVGDKVLKNLGQLFIRDGILRKQDIVGRFGGEEFIVILPNTNGNNALGPAIRLARELDKVNFSTNENKAFRVTLSIGISEYHPSDKDNEAIIHRADQAMYYAKQHGRNQIIIYEKIFN
jgi:diguanylate cyclase (GGDEF)-like protein